MSEIQMTNLDIQCADLGRKIAGIKNMDEKTINAALSVLEEQGPYAMFLYVRARHKEIAPKIEAECAKRLKGTFQNRIPDSQDMLKVVQALAGNLDDLLFARDLLRTALSYARYHLKAKGSGEEAS